MQKIGLLVLVGALSLDAQASWYWPFGSDDEIDDKIPARISELIEPASVLIDEASDFAADGKVNEAVEKYRAALGELDRIERENPERAKGVEFATVRNKRAYVNAAIDSMLLSQVKSNAKAVAVSDTTELEKKLAKEKSKAAMEAISKGDYAAANAIVRQLLKEKPNSAAALNLKAVVEIRQEKFREAEATLDQAIMSNPHSHFAYYNMARLLLQSKTDSKAAAKRYYETGRAMGGPEDAQLEAAFK